MNTVELYNALKQMGLSAEIIDNDYDDYGSEYGVRVFGECADLVMLQDYYHGFDCEVSCKSRNTDQYISYEHGSVVGGVAKAFHCYEFVLKSAVEKRKIEADEVVNWVRDNAKFLEADNKLFYRVDRIQRGDLSGAFKWGNAISSYDKFKIADEDFYTEKTIDFSKHHEKMTQEYITSIEEFLNFY